jgi:hypothetical protein
MSMFEFTWQQAFDEWTPEPGDDEQAAFKAGWFAALAQIIALLEDERRQADPHP